MLEAMPTAEWNAVREQADAIHAAQHSPEREIAQWIDRELGRYRVAAAAGVTPGASPAGATARTAAGRPGYSKTAALPV
jgi:hypothetical protein